MKHYSEADLLETYYMKPGESMPAMMHLADCSDCAARYERLEQKLRSLASCGHAEKPETFWARQRIAVMRRIDARRAASAGSLRRIAAAAALAAVIGGVFAIKYDQLADVATQQVVEHPVPADPWESDELSDFHSVVAWESWIEKGDSSL